MNNTAKTTTEMHVHVVTGPFWARVNIAAKTTIGNACTSREWGSRSMMNNAANRSLEMYVQVVNRGINPWWTMPRKRPLQMHEKGTLRLGPRLDVFNKLEMGPYASWVAYSSHLWDCLNPYHYKFSKWCLCLRSILWTAFFLQCRHQSPDEFYLRPAVWLFPGISLKCRKSSF